jgi:D-glycero-beta-D-manno-heptose-7-phosphate kinase
LSPQQRRTETTKGHEQTPPGPRLQKGKALSVVERFQGKKICIVGDIIADIYIFGRPYRLSREAPVVVIEHQEERLCPGSAGNTIANLADLGAEVYPLGLIGTDDPGDRLINAFREHETVKLEGLIRHEGSTVTKTRILAGDTHVSKQQVIRIDRDAKRQMTARERALLLRRLADIAPLMDGFILSDYGHGVVDGKVVSFMRDLAKKRIVVGDSRYNLKLFTGLTVITPNEHEAYSLAGLREGSPIERVGETIMRRMGLKALLVTRGNRGMSLFLEDGRHHHIPISGSDDVADVTGAGDTVCAALTLALVSGADFYTACRIANHAGGVVVMKRGTATVTKDELREAIEGHGADNH